jgi:hypothetical protein
VLDVSICRGTVRREYNSPAGNRAPGNEMRR